MRLEDMKREVPETPDFIHKMVVEEVEKQLKTDGKVVSLESRKPRKWSGVRAAAAALACVLATSTAAYAGTKIYRMYLDQQGTYAVTTGVKEEETAEKPVIPEEIHEITFVPGYIPEGMEWTEENKMSYPEHAGKGGFSFVSALLDEGSLDQVMQDEKVVDSEARIFGDYEGVYLKYQNLQGSGTFNQRIYLLCPDLYRVVTIYIGDDVSREDAVRVAENLKLTETDTMVAAADLYTWKEQIHPEVYETAEAVTSVKADQLPVRAIGEDMTLPVDGEDTEGNPVGDKQIAARVDTVQIADDLQLLAGSELPEGWEDAVDPEGKLKESTLSYVRNGDGKETLDEVVKTETVKRKLVYATVTYTNTADEELDHILYLGTLMKLKAKDGSYTIDLEEEQGGEGFDRILPDKAYSTAEMTWCSVQDDYGNGGNYLPALKPGESVKVQMAWIVNEPDLEQLYLNLGGDGAAYEFSERTLDTGVVKITES